MRQRRHVLQVTTFPFLAVLLCTMGSLILILMVVDRRARIVANARAAAEIARRYTAEDEDAKARREEWERRRRDLHDWLLREMEELRQRGALLDEQAIARARAIAEQRTAAEKLQLQYQHETEQLERAEKELAKLQAELNGGVRQSEKINADLARLFADLAELERALLNLKALRRQQAQTYSLIPWRGKHGASRRPIYVECNRGGVIFHSDQLAIDGLSVEPMAIRREVDRRIAASQDAAGADAVPYLLVLLRPTGITNYYRLKTALEGLKIDFGYEFIDEDWVLDFPDDNSNGTIQPWMAARPSPASGAAAPNLARPAPEGRPGNGATLGAPQATGPSSGGGGTGNGPATGGHPSAEGPFIAGGAPTGNGPARGGRQPPGGPYTAGNSPSGGRPPGGNGADFSGTLPGGFGPGGSGGTSPGDAQASGGLKPPEGPFLPGGSPSGSGTGTGTNGSGTGPPGTESTARSGQGSPGAGTSRPSGTSSANGGTAAPGQPRGNGSAPGADPSSANGANNGTGQARAGTAAPAANGTPSGTSGAGANGQATAPPATAAGQPGNGQQASRGPARPTTPRPLNSAAPPKPPDGEDNESGNDLLNNLFGGSRPPPRGPKAKPVRFASNRDWVIPVECVADAVLLPTTGRRFALSELQGQEVSSNALLQFVQSMIERKQASVRAGEGDWHPQIRFVVRPDGFRSYYLAYPALEPLRLPMVREVTEKEPEEGRP